MRILIMLFALVAGLSSLAYGTDAGTKEAFMAAYKEYQQAMADQKPFKAKEPARQAYEIGKKLFGREHKNTANLALNYGQLLRDDEAVEVLQEALAIFEVIYGENAVELVDPLIALAEAKAEFGRLHYARKYYSRALEITEQHQSKESFLAGVIQLEIGRIALSEAGSRGAMRYFKKAEEIFQTHEGQAAKIRLAQTRFWMGKYELAAKDYSDATEYLLASLEVFEEISPQANMTMTNHAFLISAYERQNMRDAATKHCIAIAKAKPIKPDQDYKPVYKVQPKYPRAAIEIGAEGFVLVSTTIDKEGFPVNYRVLEREGPSSLERAALDAMKKFRYVPRFENGEAVETHDVKYRFTFGLAD